LLPAGIERRKAHARERSEDGHATRHQARWLASPEWRVRGKRDQLRNVAAKFVGDMNRLLGICHADVNVHPEHQLLTRDEAERVHEAPVAIVADDALLLPAGEGMSARRTDLEVLPTRTVPPDPAQGCPPRSRPWHVRG